MNPAVKALREVALKHPETSEGVACAGTPLERRAIKVRKKTFLFLGHEDAMLKLKDSLGEAKRLAKREPDRCKAGGIGWVTVVVRDDAVTPPAMLRKWVDESYRLLAPKTLTRGPKATATPMKKKRKKKAR